MRTRGDARRSVEELASDAWIAYREWKHEKFVARRKELEKIVKVGAVGERDAVCRGTRVACRPSSTTF